MRHVLGVSSAVAHRSTRFAGSFGASAPSCVVVLSLGWPLGWPDGWLTSVYGCSSLSGASLVKWRARFGSAALYG